VFQRVSLLQLLGHYQSFKILPYQPKNAAPFLESDTNAASSFSGLSKFKASYF
jgi:hypothetical protein